MKSGVSALSNTSNAFGTAVDDTFKQAAVAEEEAAFNHYRQSIGSPSAASTNPFLSEEPAVIKTEPILDLFGDDIGAPAPTSTQAQATNALDDLLSLGGNPFADFSTPAIPTSTASVPSSAPDFFSDSSTTNGSANMWASNGFGNANVFQQPPTQPFASAANNLSGLFNTNEPSVFDPLADPMKTAAPVPQANAVQAPQRPPAPSKILTGDLESSLTSLVENLTMDSGEFH